MDWKTCNKNLPRLVRLSAPRAIPRLFRVLTSNITVSQPVTGLLSSITLVLLYLSRIDGMAYHEQSKRTDCGPHETLIPSIYITVSLHSFRFKLRVSTKIILGTPDEG